MDEVCDDKGESCSYLFCMKQHMECKKKKTIADFDIFCNISLSLWAGNYISQNVKLFFEV